MCNIAIIAKARSLFGHPSITRSRPKWDFGSGLRSRLARVIIFPETVRNVRKGMNALQRLLVRPRLPLRSIPPPAPMGAGVKALIVEVIRVGRSEARRVGKECVSTCRYRGSQ